MEQKTLIERYSIALQALASFEESINLMNKYAKNYKQGENQEVDSEYRAHRDSVIKRFEYTLDTFWKYLKFFLEERIGVIQNAPKPVLRECFRNTFITEQEVELALAMINARNMTSHIYREEIAESIWQHIPAYRNFIKEALQRMHPHKADL